MGRTVRATEPDESQGRWPKKEASRNQSIGSVRLAKYAADTFVKGYVSIQSDVVQLRDPELLHQPDVWTRRRPVPRETAPEEGEE